MRTTSWKAWKRKSFGTISDLLIQSFFFSKLLKICCSQILELSGKNDAFWEKNHLSFDKGLVFFFSFVTSLVLFSIHVFEHFNLKSILVFFFVLFFFRPFFIFVVLFLDNSTSWIMPIQLYHNGRYSYFPCLVLKGMLLNILLSKIHIFEMIGFLMMKCCFRFFWC